MFWLLFATEQEAGVILGGPDESRAFQQIPSGLPECGDGFQPSRIERCWMLPPRP